MGAPRRIAFVVPEDAGDLRLDRLLARCVPGLSRTRARVLLDIGGVFVDGKRVKVAGRTLRPGQRVQATLGDALARASSATGRGARDRDAAALPEMAIVHEDADVVVVDKPSGIPVAATAESDAGDVAALLERRAGAPVRVVHRIDAPTSGLVVLAKTPAAARELSRQLAAHEVAREYRAVLAGRVPEDAGVVDHPIGDRRARSRFAVERRLGDVATVVRWRLETGRTHQIRIHARHIGHPVLGDRVHGTRTDVDPPRLALHAAVLAFRHPTTGAPFAFRSPWPADLRTWLRGLEAGAFAEPLPTPPPTL